MKRAQRQRNKKKFGTGGVRGRRSKAMTVKIKPKEEEPCRTRNPQPKVRTPGP